MSSIALLYGCSKAVVIDDASVGKSIQFNAGGPVGKAAIVGDFPDGSAFSVWGRMVKDSQTAMAFDGETVTKSSNVWRYDGTRYWIPGWTYDFYAVYPAGTDAVLPATENVINITGFDCSATGADAKDLMTAFASGMSYDGKTPPGPVSLNFAHQLTRLDFVGKSVGGKATIHKVEVSGITISADCVVTRLNDNSSSSEWLNGNTGSLNSAIDTELDAASTENKSVVGDIMVIPQTLENAKVTVTYSTDTESNKTAEYSLSIQGLTAWEAGKSYRYSFEVTGGGYLVFGKPTVNTWNHATGGNVIIDVTQ